MKSLTFLFLSFNKPNGVTAPGYKFNISFSSSEEAKVSGLVLYSFLNLFKSIFLLPSITIK